ncbi:alpha/beta hydrolase [Bacillus clarus]|uniref:Alpha/beta hydrolase n=1 Tax=Bacillus clarus TaxID=2338372 RepID=A0A090YSH0_9BACI|nr:alpha/beta hydrolase [Bacillus clarus]KFM95040.1 prolyl oligopeptidase family protein [Bacillus clarus]RFT63429.1 alpha/beta hydrolase [Bacillus clarus]
MTKIIKSITIILCIVITSLVIYGVYKNTFNINLKEVTIKTSKNELHGIVSMPENTDKKPGLVIFIHGDGPADASYQEGYYSAWEVLNKNGFATLSWDKPGIGKSSGDWLNQSMEDRVKETKEAIHWAKNNLDIDESKIGVWGASQGGWVLPKVMNEEKLVSFGIAVSPAINWMQQGEYNTVASMKKEGKTKKEIDRKLKQRNEINKLLEEEDVEKAYNKYQEMEKNKGNISLSRWTFIRTNMNVDATEEFKKINKRLYLIVGGQDINVDVDNTIEGYSKNVNSKLLDIKKLPNADHSMVLKEYIDMGVGRMILAILNPRVVIDPGYLEKLQEISKTEKLR